MNKRSLPALALSAAVTVALLGACSTAPAQTDPTPATPAVVTTAPATPAPAPAPVETEAPVAEPTAEATSEAAPVRIGTDTPGQAPAAEKGYTREGWREYVAAADKYVVAVGQGKGGWLWKVFGADARGSMREVGNSGYSKGEYLPSRDAAAAGPFIVDGRVLDRAEFILVLN